MPDVLLKIVDGRPERVQVERQSFTPRDLFQRAGAGSQDVEVMALGGELETTIRSSETE